jgi:photosystem II stability/assembly factor-like uncharacterized protein
LLTATFVLLAQNHQWQPIGPWGGKIIDIAIAPNKSNVLYALHENTVLNSKDYGLSWYKTGSIEKVNPDRPVGFLYHLSVHPEISDCVYLGGQFTLRRSQNGGQSWEVVIDSLGFDFEYVIFNPQNYQTLYVTSFDHTIEDQIDGGGIFKSSDGGCTWQFLQTQFSGSSVYDLEISKQDTSLLYVSTTQGLFKTGNAGQSWIQLYPEIQGKIHDIALGYESTIIYASFFTLDCQDGGVIKSLDGGMTWAHCDNGLPHKCIGTLVVDPFNAERLYAALSPAPLNETYGLYITENEGLAWKRIADTLSDSIFYDIELDPLQPGKIYLAADIFGIYFSDNNSLSWQLKNNNINFISGPFAINPSNINNIFMAEGSSIFRTIDGGTNWERLIALEKSSDDWSIEISPSATNVIYAFQGLLGSNNMFMSDDGGNTWEAWTDSILPQRSKLKVDPARSSILYTISDMYGIFKSIDAGKSWITKNEGLQRQYVNDIEFNPLNPNILIAATDKGIYKSVDSGDQWCRIGSDSAAIQSVSISVQDTSIIFSLTPSFLDRYAFLRRSYDGGIHWQNIMAPDSMEISNFVIDPLNHSTIWITTIDEFIWTSKVLFSNDAGQNWYSPDGEQFDIFITDIDIPSFMSQKVFALTYAGLYRLDFSTGVDVEQPKFPSDVKLFQNYPNPFNAETEIKYQISDACHITLKIYNLLGQGIRTLVTKDEAVGDYIIQWDGKDYQGQNLASGIYIYRLEAGSFVASKKLVLIQ